MAVILITGSDGQLGNELQLLSRNYYGYDFIFTDIRNLDLTDSTAVKEFIGKNSPDWIINCAAYNLVDKAENEPETAMKVNGYAVRNIADAIQGSTCRFIHISSDYVYDGDSAVPYSETSEPDPRSAYGRSKLAGEKFALSHQLSMVIRTSWLYSSFGNNFVKTMLRLGHEKDSLNVVFDQTGTPTYAADLAGAIMHIVAGVIRNQLAFYPGLYNYSNEGACTWFDFAVEIMKEAGLNCKVRPVLSIEFVQAAKRPSYSVMNKAKIRENYNLEIPHWRESLKRCMEKLG
ncbi:MAG TPA: dTDP-4-dehydrorhamnose reductase [Bacteroidales bacterium]|jgi:dTDP-4-dehydrorhamnose reductase|nr:dTDP-4-dehydrorhamnose reductase [Bacteroidales bacterium]